MANTSISNLAAGAAVSATDLVPNVQTVGVGPVKTTAAQLKTFMSSAPTITGHPTIEGVTSTGATGTGNLVFSNTPSLTTPAIGAATGDSLALNGATLGSNKLAVTGTATINGVLATGGSTGNGYLQINRSDVANIGSIEWVSSGDELRYYNRNGGPHTFYVTGSNEIGRFDSTGLRIGTTSAAGYKLWVVTSASNIVNSAFEVSSASYASTMFYATCATAASGSYDFFGCYANSVGQFRVSGNGVIYAQNNNVQSISDARLKENIRDSEDGLDTIMALKPRRYDWKAGYGNDRKNDLGFVAQEIETVFPDAVSEMKLNKDDVETYKTVGPAALIPVLVKALQELKNEFDAYVAAHP